MVVKSRIGSKTVAWMLTAAILLVVAPAAAQVVFPGAPQNLAATAGPNTGEISLTWDAANDGGLPITNHRIYRGTASGGEAFHAEVGNVLAYLDSGLGNGATYFYQVSAVNLIGEGPLSSEASATTFSVPDAPTNLTATPGPNAAEITLDWLEGSGSGGSTVTAFRVYRATGNSSAAMVAEVGAGVLTYTDVNLTVATGYHYHVTAVNLAGESAPSNPACTGAFPWVADFNFLIC